MTRIDYCISNNKLIGFRVTRDNEVVNFSNDVNGINMFVKCINNIIKEIEEAPLDLHENFEDWDERINWLNKTNRRLVEIDEIYLAESDKILEEARENNVDFKAIYGANNQSIRKQYVDEQLSDLLDEKKELEFRKADDNRRISLLKRLIDMKVELIKYCDCNEKI